MSKEDTVLTNSEDLNKDSTAIRSERNGASLTNTRRGFIGLAATGLAGIGVASTSVSASATGYEDEYRTVINVVEAGADNTGNTSITPVLEDNRRDHTLFYFPPGEYLMDSQFRFTNFEKFGVVGEEATLIPGSYDDYNGSRTRLFRLGTQDRPGGHVRFENFDVDQTAPETGIRVIDTYASERLEVRDIRIYGEHDSGTSGPGHFNLTQSEATGIVERFRAPDGGAWVDETPHAGNHWRGPIGIEANRNEGTLRFRRCWLGAFPDNGLYASGGSGKIIVDGGVYRNSNGANIRVGGNGSEVNWPTVEVDSTRDQDGLQRGIRLERGQDLTVNGAAIRITSPMPTSRAISVMNSCDGARIKRTEIEMSGDKINHGIVISQAAGPVLVEDTNIVHETAGGYPIWIRDSDSTDRVHCRRVSITGVAGDASGFRDGIRCERDNSRFSNCEVDQRGTDGVNRNAFVSTASDTTLYRNTFRAERFPYIELGSDNLIHYCDFESYRDGEQSVCLYDSAESIEFRYNRLVNGIEDRGASDIVEFRTTE